MKTKKTAYEQAMQEAVEQIDKARAEANAQATRRDQFRQDLLMSLSNRIEDLLKAMGKHGYLLAIVETNYETEEPYQEYLVQSCSFFFRATAHRYQIVSSNMVGGRQIEGVELNDLLKAIAKVVVRTPMFGIKEGSC
jgi:hypothetical protein